MWGFPNPTFGFASWLRDKGWEKTAEVVFWIELPVFIVFAMIWGTVYTVYHRLRPRK